VNPALEALIKDSHLVFAEKQKWLENNKPAALPPGGYRDALQDDKGGRLEWGTPDYYERLEREMSDYELHCMVLKQLNDSLDFPFDPKLNSSWRDYAGDALDRIISPALRHLCPLAEQGDSSSIKVLARIAIDSTRTLGAVRKKFLKRLAGIACHEIAWPVLKSECLYFDETGKLPSDADRELLRQLEVGKRHPIKGQRWNPKGDAWSEVLTDIVAAIQSRRSFPYLGADLRPYPEWLEAAGKLPDLSPRPTPIAKWWRVIKLYLKARYPTNDSLVKAHPRFDFPSSKKGLGERAAWVRNRLRLRLDWMAGAGRVSPQKSRQVARRACKAKPGAAPSNQGSKEFNPEAFALEQKRKGNLI
jgi:hypothetical protein